MNAVFSAEKKLAYAAEISEDPPIALIRTGGMFTFLVEKE